MSRLGNILNAILNPFGKTLWTGTWSSGTMTISGISKYSLFLVTMGGVPLPAYSDGSRVRILGATGTTSHTTHAGSFSFEGDTCTFIAGTSMVHTPDSNHTILTSGKTITKVVGLVPNWGGVLQSSIFKACSRFLMSEEVAA